MMRGAVLPNGSPVMAGSSPDCSVFSLLLLQGSALSRADCARPSLAVVDDGSRRLLGRLPVELSELLGDPTLQPAAVFPLVDPQALDLLLQADPLVGELAQHLVVLGLGLLVQRVGADPAVPFGGLG